MNINEFNKDINNFCMLYNRGLEYTDKNLLFSNFYRHMGEALELGENDLINLEKVIYSLSEQIHLWDDLIDREGLSPEAGYEKIRVINNKELKKYFNKFSIEKNTLFDICSNSLIEIRDYFILEKNALNAISDFNRIVLLLKKGNCDFDFYNRIFFKIIKNDNEKAIESFLTDYLTADLIADHIVDLEKDIEKASYNPLLLLYLSGEYMNYKGMCSSLNQTSDPYSSLMERDLLSLDNIFSSFTSLAEDHIIKAKKNLVEIYQKNLQELLAKYLKGLSEGFKIFRKYNYLLSMDKDKRELYKKLILKPAPWERVVLNDITGSG